MAVLIVSRFQRGQTLKGCDPRCAASVPCDRSKTSSLLVPVLHRTLAPTGRFANDHAVLAMTWMPSTSISTAAS